MNQSYYVCNYSLLISWRIKLRHMLQEVLIVGENHVVNLLAPPLAGINHLLESLSILLRTVVALESVLFRHRHAIFSSALQI